MFSKQALFELVWSIVKIVIIFFICYSVIKDNLMVLLTVYDLEIQDSLGILFDLVIDLGMKVSLVYFVLAVADLFFQKWKHKQDLKA